MGFLVSKIVKTVLSDLEKSNVFDKLLDRFAKKLASEIQLNSSGVSVIGNASTASEKPDDIYDDFDSMSAIAKAAGTVSKKVSIEGKKVKEEVVKADTNKNKQVMDILNDL
jgi:hypothetical protein